MLQVAPESIIAVSLGRPQALRGAVRSNAVAAMSAFVTRAIRMVRDVLGAKARLAPCVGLRRF